jgi:hypothetical protein
MVKAKKGTITIKCNYGGSKTNETDEENALRKQQQTGGFGDIPYKVYQYCSQNCSNYPTHIERIPIDALKDYSTACGDTPNNPFTPAVRDFIKAGSGKDFVIAEVYDDSKDMTEEFESTKVIINMAVHWNGDEKTRISLTNQFSDMISNNAGSLRPEENFEDGWDTYESE